ncbi:MAG: transcription initiation factor IIB family protein [Promethearchaeota archaeon]
MEIEYPINNNKVNVCLECGGNISLLQEKGEIICNNCGLIISERNIDITNEGERYFNAEEMAKKRKIGPPTNTLLNNHHSTFLKKNYFKNPDLKRAVKQNNFLEWRQKNLITAANEIKRIAANLRLPDYVKDASMLLYKKYLKHNILNGRSISGMIAACLYYVCRANKISRSLKEISNRTSKINENMKEVYSCYKSLIKELNLKPPPPDPVSFVPRLIAELDLDPKVESPTIRVIRAFVSRACSAGRDPRGIAAGALYLVCRMINIKVSQKEIAKIAKITNITLCKRYKEILDNLFSRKESINED